MKRPMLIHSIEKVHVTENGFMNADLNNLSRMVVPGGWVYFNNVRTEFVPDKEIEIFSSKADMEVYISQQRAIEEMQTNAPLPLIRPTPTKEWWQFWK